MSGDTIGSTKVAWARRQTDDRRRHRFSFVLHERRTGFDRRRSSRPGWWTSLLLYLREHPTMLVIGLLGLNVMNALDMLLTLQATDLGATEVNPMIRALLDTGVPLAIAVKLLVVALASLAIWRLKRYRAGLAAGLVVAASYATVVAYHVINLAVSSQM